MGYGLCILDAARISQLGKWVFDTLESDGFKTRLREMGMKQLKELGLCLSDVSSYLMEDKDRLDSSCNGAKTREKAANFVGWGLTTL